MTRRLAVGALMIGVGLLSATAGATTIRSGHVAGWSHDRPSWVPGGDEILFWQIFEPAKSAPDVRLALVTPDGHRLRRIGRPPSEGWAIATDVSISPDGRRLLITRHPDVGELSVILVKDLATGSERVLTPEGFEDTGGNWSPDGRRVSFVRSGAGVGTRVPFTAQADGSGAAPAGVGKVWSAHFLPDGNHLVASRELERGSVVSVIGLDDGRERRLTAPGRWFAADWSADGSRLLLAEDRREIIRRSGAFAATDPGGCGSFRAPTTGIGHRTGCGSHTRSPSSVPTTTCTSRMRTGPALASSLSSAEAPRGLPTAERSRTPIAGRATAAVSTSSPPQAGARDG